MSHIYPNCFHSYHWLKIFINVIFRPVTVPSKWLTAYRSCTPKIFLYLLYCVLYARPNESSLISSPLTISVGRYYHEAPHYALFSTPLFPPPSQSQISPSAPQFRITSNDVIPVTWETKFHTHTKQQAELYKECKLTQSKLNLANSRQPKP